MASKLAIAIRQREAQERVTGAARKIAHALGVPNVNLAPTHKDAGIQAAMQLEAVADFLEATASSLASPPHSHPVAETKTSTGKPADKAKGEGH